MNTTMLPGFSAEASSCRHDARYQVSSAPPDSSHIGEVIPAIKCQSEDGFSLCCSTTMCCWVDGWAFRSGCFNRRDFA
jgi:hypothetical protein